MSKKNQYVNVVLKQNNESLDKTRKIFKTCYYLAKNNRPYMDHSDLIEIQSLNGLDLGTCLHSRFSCSKIVKHISNEMKILSR